MNRIEQYHKQMSDKLSQEMICGIKSDIKNNQEESVIFIGLYNSTHDFEYLSILRSLKSEKERLENDLHRWIDIKNSTRNARS